MFSWKELWSIVFVTTVTPLLCAWYARTFSAKAFFGTASDWLEPTVTFPLAGEPAVTALFEDPDPQAARAAMAATLSDPSSSTRLLKALEANDVSRVTGARWAMGSDFGSDTNPPGEHVVDADD